MNTNPSAIRILCYGDSNTWGYAPGTGKRYELSVRWTGLLQKNLGDQFEVIEEGLNARTTAVDDPENEGKNGATYLKPCLQSHHPLDLVILMLGSNDLKKQFARTPEQIAEGIDQLLAIVNDSSFNYGKIPKVILLSPPYIDESVEEISEKCSGGEEKSKQLAKYYQQVADKYNCEFIDIAQYVKPSKIDGCHLDPDAHREMSKVLESKIRKMEE